MESSTLDSARPAKAGYGWPFGYGRLWSKKPLFRTVWPQPRLTSSTKVPPDSQALLRSAEAST
ncbi:hypothetical protein ACFQ2M_34935 [Kitasatospora saccharophila]|uniref:hypothetical protein n=1 Tax=Kitasatospora saccharophila TaxID=407973 RepID=UPI0036440052